MKDSSDKLFIEGANAETDFENVLKSADCKTLTVQPITYGGFEKLLKYLKTDKKIECLDVGFLGIGKSDGEVLNPSACKDALASNNTLKTLRFNGGYLKGEALEALKNAAVKRDFDEIYIGAIARMGVLNVNDLRNILDFVEDNKVKKLVIHDNSNVDFFRSLGSFLERNNHIQSLQILDPIKGEEGIKALASGLSHSHSLKEVSLRLFQKEDTEETLVTTLEAINKNKNIENITLEINPLSLETANKLIEIINRNDSVASINIKYSSTPSQPTGSSLVEKAKYWLGLKEESEQQKSASLLEQAIEDITKRNKLAKNISKLTEPFVSNKALRDLTQPKSAKEISTAAPTPSTKNKGGPHSI